MVLLLRFVYEKTKAQEQFNNLPTVTLVRCGKTRTSDCMTSKSLQCFCLGFVCNVASVALGATIQIPHMSMTD